MKKIFFLILVVPFLFAACNGKKSDNDTALQLENDSLRQANAEIRNYYEEIVTYMTEIDADMQAIKNAENFVIEQRNDTGDISASTQSRIKADIELLSQTLQRNRERIAELEKKLNSSLANSSSLKKAIEQYKIQIAEKDSLIVGLQASLAERDVRIDELDVAVNNLSSQVADLSDIRDTQKNIIAAQDTAINEVYYVYAYTDALRENKILTGGGLFSKTEVMKGDFNQDYFTKADRRTLHSIFLESKKVKICTSHPDATYQLVKDGEGFITLNIIDPDKFWATSRYLVVELK